MRTQEEIVERYQQRRVKDLLGFEVGEYIHYLDYEHAKPYLIKGTAAEEWKPLPLKAVVSRMREYMSFAWSKANNCRGISANRSILHFIAWIWLSGDDAFSNEIDRDLEHNYFWYGKPILVKICEHYGWDSRQWDDGVRTNTED